jgi:rRNA processing protein Gar1
VTKTTTRCPSWCATGYRCTALNGGEHRSEPVVLARSGTGVGAVVSLVQPVRRPYPTVEIRLSIRLRTSSAVDQQAELWALLRRLGALTKREATR